MSVEEHVLCPHFNYYVKMRGVDGTVKLMEVDMTFPYHSISEIYTRMHNYVKDGVCWKLLENKIYMCDNVEIPAESQPEKPRYSDHEIWFVKVRHKNSGNINYVCTKYVDTFPKKSFKEVFDNITIPDGYEIADRKNLYICRQCE